MRRVSLNGCGSGDKRFVELNYHMQCEHKEVRDGVMGEGQDLSEEDESRINAVPQDVNEGCERAVLQPQQPQASVVRWDRFLHVRSLKVLLVESDDSTRHVVSALLRNCSYEVTAVSNGIQAWKILRDLTNHIDLILVEVVMPGLSGIALLCKIMKHKTCKTIPVIMMSSLDSMGIVFKCLSKGAVDFLVKPIRKNELKNLWQHVWRRCHSSSGSGSESGIQMQKSINSKCEESDNDSSSNDADDHVGDGSDNGSGTESSWTRRVVDHGSPQHTFPWDQVVNQTDSTCAQVIHAKSEAYTNTWVPSDATKECSEGDKKRLENIAMGIDLEVGVPRNVQLEYECEKVCTNVLGTKHDKMPELVIEKDNEQCHEAPLELNCEKSICKPKAHNGFTTNSTNHGVETIASETPNGLSKLPEFDDNMTSGPKEVPSLELSLNRVRGTGDVGTITHDRCNILRHSDMSAFSRYNVASTNQAPTGNVGSCSPLGNSLEAMKTDSLHNQQFNESSNNNNMGSTAKNILTKSATFNEKSTSTSTEKHINSSAFRPVQNVYICPPLQIMPQKVDDLATKASATQPSYADQQVQVQHHHHHYHHHVHHVHNMQHQQQQQPEPNNEDLSLNIAASGLPCMPTNVLGGPMEGKGGNYSLNGSASGSNNGTSRQNGSSKDVNARGATIHTDIGVTGKSGVEGASESGSGVDQNQFSQRVAALTKFRQKRKERCFEKKVRYQSRKKLAEQRPRVRGQFVRQRVCEDNGDADS